MNTNEEVVSELWEEGVDLRYQFGEDDGPSTKILDYWVYVALRYAVAGWNQPYHEPSVEVRRLQNNVLVVEIRVRFRMRWN